MRNFLGDVEHCACCKERPGTHTTTYGFGIGHIFECYWCAICVNEHAYTCARCPAICMPQPGLAKIGPPRGDTQTLPSDTVLRLGDSTLCEWCAGAVAVVQKVYGGVFGTVLAVFAQNLQGRTCGLSIGAIARTVTRLVWMDVLKGSYASHCYSIRGELMEEEIARLIAGMPIRARAQ